MIYLSETLPSALFGIWLVIVIVFVCFEVFDDGHWKENKKDS